MADLPTLRARVEAAQAKAHELGDELYHRLFVTLAADLLAALEAAQTERDEARKTNARIHRRVQEFESMAAQQRLASYWVEIGERRERERAAERLKHEGLDIARRLGLSRKANRELTTERDEARAELTAIRAALGNGADEAVWRPGETLAEAVGWLRDLVDMASGFEISEPTVAARFLGGVRVERCGQLEGPDLWAVRQRGNVLGRDGHWTYEPIPSSRDDAFMAQYRFASRDEAIEAGRAAIAGAPPPRCTATSRERTVEIGGHMHTVRTRCPLPAGHEGPHAEALGDDGGPNG